MLSRTRRTSAHLRAHLSGVARLPDGLVLIHDLATFLREAEATTLDDAVAAAAAHGDAT